MRVLFLIPHPPEGASGRYRILQYLPFLERGGITFVVRPFMSPGMYHVLYQPGRVGAKVAMTLAALSRRLADVVRSSRADVVVVHREALPLGTALLERMIASVCPRMIYDFDDAIYLNHASRANAWMRLFRDGRKTGIIIKLSAHVIVGNRTLETYVRRYHSRVSVIPTPVDTVRYSPRPEPRQPKKRLVIGWIGSHSTAAYLGMLQEALTTLTNRYPQVDVRLVGAGHAPLHVPGLQSVAWQLEQEVDELHQFDIGVMPMPDDEWARGKCGFKALLYMSVGIPVVASPTGVNREIVRDGVNGFLAATPAAWVARLAQLIEDAPLRERMGLAGRAVAEAEYSVCVTAPRFLQVLCRRSEHEAAEPVRSDSTVPEPIAVSE